MEKTLFEHILPEFINLIETYAKITGYTVSVLLEDQYRKPNYHLESRLYRLLGHKNDFCLQVKSGKHKKGCSRYDIDIRCKKSRLLMFPYIDECPNGVTEVIVPIIMNGIYTGSIFIGQFLKTPIVENCFYNVCQKVKERGVNESDLLKAYKQFRYVETEELLQSAKLLFYSILYLGSHAEIYYDKQKQNIRNKPIIYQVLHYLNELQDKKMPSASEIAKKFDITPEYFSKIFKKTVKKKFKDYCTEIKIFKTTELLVYTDMSISRIAIENGFTQQSYFARIFKQKTGLTPFEYRNSNKTSSDCQK